MWVRTFRQWNGRWGFNQLPWLANHLRGELFCLGRLQFQIGRFFLPQIILRWAREVVVLAPDGLRYRADGLIDGANGGCDPQSRTTRYRENAAFHEGNLISSEGRVTGETGVFAKADWRRAVVPDDDTLYFHIPATGPMEHASCGESFARARDFFPRYFPAFQPRAFCSTSWLFDSSLANILPATSNIVRFQREFYLLPLEQANDNQMFERVFAKRYEDIAAAPQITSLQKAIVAYYTHGNRLCSARACLLFEDNGWNTPYRK